MALLSKDSILRAQDVRTKEIEVPEWGGSVRVRTMTVAERNEFTRRATSKEEKSDIAAWLVALLAVDGDGKALFSADDVKVLEAKNFRALERVADAVLEVNGFNKEKVEEAKKN